MDVIIPAAGLSTRYNSDKPKYLLYDYSGKMLIYHVALPYIKRGDRVHIVVLREHAEKFRALDHLEASFINEINAGYEFNVVILDNLTRGPADTVYQALEKMNISGTSPFLIKDCDNFWDVTVENEYEWPNQVYTYNLNDVAKTIRNPASKSYVITNKEDVVLKIVEKQVVSSQFCCGGYRFGSVDDYKKNFREVVKITTSEIFVSHVISRMTSVFAATPVTGLVDLGTQEDWDEWNNKPTIFCDIDGTLVKAKDRLSYYEPSELLSNNVDLILRKVREGCQVIFTTARPWVDFEVTLELLKSMGFEDPYLICGLHNAPRVLINDYNISTNKYPTAIAYNVRRDADTLSEVYR